MVSTAPDPASKHADLVRQRILEGAARAFSRSGLPGTSVPQIAAECGVSVGLLYRYFASKTELYTSICTSQMEEEAASLRQRMGLIQDRRQRLEHAVDFYLGRLSENGGAGLLLSALAEAHTNQTVRQTLRLRRDAIRSFIETFLRDGIAAGELASDLPVGTYARAITMTLDGAVADWAVSGPDLDPVAIRAAIIDLVTGLLGTKSPQRPMLTSASA
ncbi:MAG: TetR/AcrR family transcriptional regulator [Candidatus Dormibacteria bacterium]